MEYRLKGGFFAVLNVISVINRGLTRIWQRLQRRTVVEIAPHLKLGQEGERLAERFLKKQGYRLVVTNLKIGLGRGISGRPLSGEIDIVAYDQATLCFIEVKTRTSTDIAPPEAAVDRTKQRQIIRTGRRYRQILSILDEPCRYDVVSVIMTDPRRPVIEIRRGYFTEESLRKQAYAWERYSSG